MANSGPKTDSTTRHKAVMKSGEETHPPQKQIDKQILIEKWLKADNFEDQEEIRGELLDSHGYDPLLDGHHSFDEQN